MKEMWEIVRAYGWRHTLADFLTLVAICIALYAVVIVASGLVPQ